MKLVIDLQGAQTESRFRGIGRQVRTLARTLIAHAGAHDITVVLNRGLPSGLDELRREFLAILPRDNVRLFDIPGPVAECNEANLWRMRAAELTREAFLAGLRPDIVHVSSLFEGMNDDAVTSIGLMQAPHATSVTLFDLIPLYDPAKYLGAPAAWRFYYRRAQSLKRADLLLAISDSAKREAIESLNIPAERIEVTRLAADAAFAPVDLTPAEQAGLREKYRLPGPFILYVGPIEARKNVSLIIEAFARLPSALQAEHWMVLGGKLNADECLQLRAAAGRYGVDIGRLVFLGFIADGDLPALYAMCSLFVFPSMHEGFGLPPLEAMACGAPVLAARNSSLPEVMGRDDLLFGTFDPDELAAKMRRILTEPEHAASIRAWGIKQAGQFSSDKIGRETIEALERLHDRRKQAGATAVTFKRRPRVAFFSPLPGDRSGVADYSAELLKELARAYDVECIIHETQVNDLWLVANFVFRDVAFFQRNVESYDRIVYSIGNSSFHEHMFELLEAHPGVVILHDLFLSGVHDWLGNVERRPKADFLRELYITHGVPALQYVHDAGRRAAATRYAANRLALVESLGVIVHSRHAAEQLHHVYGEAVRDKVVPLPQLHGAPLRRSKAEARQRLGIGSDEFLVCSFGFVSDTKLSLPLFEAWTDSKAARLPAASLVYVGENVGDPCCEALRSAIAANAETVRAAITGYLDRAGYQDYLTAADLAIQLRTDSRGETSRAILDCLAAGLPVIINAHGAAAEIPAEAVLKLPDQVTSRQLTAAIDALFEDGTRRHAIALRGQRHVRTVHHPHTVGDAVIEAIETFSTFSDGARQAQVLSAMRELYAPAYPTEQDLLRVSELVARSYPRPGLRRMLFDVTQLAERDAQTGIERVTRSLLSQLLREPPPGYRVEPVRIDGSVLRFARRFTAKTFNIPSDVLPDSLVDHDAGDLYLMLEWAADRLPAIASWLQTFRQNGGRVVIGINDLLPLIMPHRFPPEIGCIAERWFQTVLTVADQLVCISRTVADDVLRFGNALRDGSALPVPVDWYHCASDIPASMPTRGLPDDAAALLAKLKRRPTFLMVGTVEPRKGHMQVLQAFAQLWATGVDAGLLIVGKKGWMVEAVDRWVSASPELGKRLLWLKDISDEFLEQLYTSCAALIAASEGEGFGLPLGEAASHRLPIIARDLPVFREIAGTHATFFAGQTADDLAGAIRSWLIMARRGRAPASSGMATLSWKESAGQLVTALSARTHYGTIGC